MKCLIFTGILFGIYQTCIGKQCDLTIQKDGLELQDGEYVIGSGGQINQIYCKALCSGPDPTPALKWYKAPNKRPVRMFRGRMYQVTKKTTFDRVNILIIRNMLYSDIGIYKCKGWLKDQGWVQKSFELTFGCKGLDHQCDTSTCLRYDKVCDGHVDCQDGTDEQNCRECKANQYHCHNGDCIDGSYVCDGYNDCIDASDELNCGCRSDIECKYGGCVSKEKVCDGHRDCMFGEDEHNCTYCMDGEYHCGDKVCIPVEHVCDAIKDCQDKSDEANCGLQVNIKNPVQEVFEGETVRLLCEATIKMDHIPYEIKWSKHKENMEKPIETEGGTLVISEAKLSDSGVYVCTGSNSISVNTDNAELIVNESIGKQCDLKIQKDGLELQDGEYVIGLGEQINQIYCKALCSGPDPTPAFKWYKAPNKRPVRMFRGRMYQVRKTFDRVNILTIRNMLYSDIGIYKCKGWLKDQGWVEKSFELTYGCRGLDHQCDTSTCLRYDKLCNGHVDCQDGTDEQNCRECKANQYHCDNGDCIDGSYVCDGYNDCDDASDELNCGCRPDIECKYGGCVSKEKVCDGHRDCTFGEDENNCTYCMDGEHHCGGKVCIPLERVCDAIEDCQDKSDEANCGIQVNVKNSVEEVFEGETVRFLCEATVEVDHIPYEVKWSKQVENMEKLINTEGSTLVISEAKISDSGVYVCTGSNSIYVDTDNAKLIVNEKCPGEFLCSNGSCISQDYVCDITEDCPDGEDELNCDFCESNQFDCGDGTCVFNDVVCDGYDDCDNGTDEVDCCVGRFQCLDGSCVDGDKLCDGLPDCSEEEDESNCTYCAIDEFHCGLGSCIPESQVCDQVSQCEDSSDEFNCGCYDKFQCGDGTCIEMSMVCDGNVDCIEDGEDELNCTCMPYQLQCDDGSCVNDTYRCDRTEDCTSGEDEAGCTCFTDSFICGDGQCIEPSAACDGIPDCSNGHDEEGCGGKITVCNETSEFRCDSKDACVPLSWRCDGTADCVDGSDECGCVDSEYHCSDGMCIDMTRKCDGVPDCEFEDDEKECNDKICAEGQEFCSDQSKCITSSQRCDQHPDCDDGSDEENCETIVVISETEAMP